MKRHEKQMVLFLFFIPKLWSLKDVAQNWKENLNPNRKINGMIFLVNLVETNSIWSMHYVHRSGKLLGEPEREGVNHVYDSLYILLTIWDPSCFLNINYMDIYKVHCSLSQSFVIKKWAPNGFRGEMLDFKVETNQMIPVALSWLLTDTGYSKGSTFIWIVNPFVCNKRQ